MPRSAKGNFRSPREATAAGGGRPGPRAPAHPRAAHGGPPSPPASPRDYSAQRPAKRRPGATCVGAPPLLPRPPACERRESAASHRGLVAPRPSACSPGCRSPRARSRRVRPPSPSAGRWGGTGSQGGLVSQPPRAAARRGPKPVSSHVTLLPEAPPPPSPRTASPRPASSYRLQPGSLRLRSCPRQVTARGSLPAPAPGAGWLARGVRR